MSKVKSVPLTSSHVVQGSYSDSQITVNSGDSTSWPVDLSQVIEGWIQFRVTYATQVNSAKTFEVKAWRATSDGWWSTRDTDPDYTWTVQYNDSDNSGASTALTVRLPTGRWIIFTYNHDDTVDNNIQVKIFVDTFNGMQAQ